MRRNWIQFNTRGPRACRQAHCLLLARLASPTYHLSDLCLCAPGASLSLSLSFYVCVFVPLRTCTWLEKPEPLLESGHDLAVTHGNGERERERGGREREATTTAAQTLKNKRELRHRGRPVGCLSLLSSPLLLRSSHRERRLLFIRARQCLLCRRGCGGGQSTHPSS